MLIQPRLALSETQKKRSLERRLVILHGILLSLTAIVVARLLDLQVIHGRDYLHIAENQQYGGIKLPARRGEILGHSSKTDDTSILATNTTLDLAYIDPLVIKHKHADVADTLADIVLTKDIDASCRKGDPSCPNELIEFYRDAFDPMQRYEVVMTAQPDPVTNVMTITGSTLRPKTVVLPDIVEIRRRFARDIEERIKSKTVQFVPLLYGANKLQLAEVTQLRIPGVVAHHAQSLVYANPDAIDQEQLANIARQLSPVLQADPGVLRNQLRQRQLRYVPIMSHLTPSMSQEIRKRKEQSAREYDAKIKALPRGHKLADEDFDPYRAIALIPEHWRYYPDTTIASHVVGFINAQQEPQYGIERTFDGQIRGQEGLIASVTDPAGGQILSSDQTFIDPHDGSTIVLTIDRVIQKKVEELLATMVAKVDAESGQVLIMDPKTGRIIALANAPLFDSNSYAGVYDKEPFYLDPTKEYELIVDVINPANNMRVLKDYLRNLSPEGRSQMSKELQDKLAELEQLYDLKKITRYYLYVGDNNRREIFPTSQKGIWLKYKNNIGVGSYVNRTIQETYEPGSVMKPITMAIAIDQGEVTALDTYDDKGPVKVDVFTIKNALNIYYGTVTMVDCITFSINTCMTSVSSKLGRKLFQSALESFGFGTVTGIELDNESPGVLKSWHEWNDALVLTASYGQGVSATPLQMITAFTALANGGKLMKPTIIDEIRKSDGTVERKPPVVLRQVIKPETTEAITAILVDGTNRGFARSGKVPGYRIAGKTGTSQIAGPGGKYETGTGSTIASYAGYAPIDKPKFVILVKLDRPKKDDFGSRSAAPLFKDIAAFLFEYYGIPPDEK